mmetsp:Transcript_31034/g.73275  ORF Transcript_31034/g.73275 Transcript_31034/m.73275 type:complete len:261 (-) Transcript_31034:359-1141(-)
MGDRGRRSGGASSAARERAAAGCAPREHSSVERAAAGRAGCEACCASEASVVVTCRPLEARVGLGRTARAARCVLARRARHAARCWRRRVQLGALGGAAPQLGPVPPTDLLLLLHPQQHGLLDAPPAQVRPGGAAREARGAVEELLLPRQQPAPLGQGLLARTGDPRREPPPPAARHVRGAHRQAAGRTRHGDAPEAALRRPRLAGARVCGPFVHGPLVGPGAQQVRAAHREAARQPALAGALRDGVEVVSSVEVVRWKS